MSASWVAPARASLNSSGTPTGRQRGRERSLVAWRTTPATNFHASASVYAQSIASGHNSISTPNLSSSTGHIMMPGELKRKKDPSLSPLYGQPIDPMADESYLLAKFIRYLGAKALHTENIFAVTVAKPELKALKRKIIAEKEGVQLGTINPVVVAEFLKVYLSKLPEPLLTFEAYDSLLMVLSLEAFQDRVLALKKVLQDLPNWHRVNSGLVLSLLNRVNFYKASNKMGSDRLASIFGPLLLRPEENLYYCEADASGIIEVTKMLIEDYELLFPKPGGPVQKKLTYESIIKKKPQTKQRLRQYKFKEPPPPPLESSPDHEPSSGPRGVSVPADKAGQPGDKQSDQTIKPLWDFRPRSETAITQLLGNRDGTAISPRPVISPRDNASSQSAVDATPIKTPEPDNETDAAKKERLLLDAQRKAQEMMQLIKTTTDYNQAIVLSRTVRDAKRYLNSKIPCLEVKEYIDKVGKIASPFATAGDAPLSETGPLYALQNIVVVAIEDILDQIQFMKAHETAPPFNDGTTPMSMVDIAQGLMQALTATPKSE